MGVSSWKIEFSFEILVGYENYFLPSCSEDAAFMFWESCWLQTSHHLGICVTATTNRMRGVQEDASWFGRFEGSSCIFSWWDLSQGQNRRFLDFIYSPSAGKPVGKGCQVQLCTILQIITSRIDAFLLNCWIKGKQKTPFFPLMQQCYKWKHVNEFPS